MKKTNVHILVMKKIFATVNVSFSSTIANNLIANAISDNVNMTLKVIMFKAVLIW